MNDARYFLRTTGPRGGKLRSSPRSWSADARRVRAPPAPWLAWRGCGARNCTTVRDEEWSSSSPSSPSSHHCPVHLRSSGSLDHRRHDFFLGPRRRPSFSMIGSRQRGCTLTSTGSRGRAVMDARRRGRKGDLVSMRKRRRTSLRITAISASANVVPMQVRGPHAERREPSLGERARAVLMKSALIDPRSTTRRPSSIRTLV